MTICVQVVDDHPLVAHGLAAMLADVADIRFLDPVGAVEDVSDEAIHVVLCDLLLPSGRSGCAAVDYLVEERGLSVVGMSGVTNSTLIANTIGVGASSFLTKELPGGNGTWERVLRAASNGRSYLTAHLAAALLNDRDLRPLPEKYELTGEAIEYVHEVLRDADSPRHAPRHNPEDQRVRQSLAAIWRVARRRFEAYDLRIDDTLRQAGALLQQGFTLEDIASRLDISKSALNGKLNDLRDRYRAAPGTGNSPIRELRQTKLLLALLHLEEASADMAALSWPRTRKGPSALG